MIKRLIITYQNAVQSLYKDEEPPPYMSDEALKRHIEAKKRVKEQQ